MIPFDRKRNRFSNAVVMGWKKSGRDAQAFLIAMAAFAFVVVLIVCIGAYQNYKFRNISPSEHLRFAIANCPVVNEQISCTDEKRSESIHHLESISGNAAEFPSATKLLSLIYGQIQAEKIKRTQVASAIAQNNLQGLAHDPFICSTSPDGKPILSFDNGQTWWIDVNSRCAERQQRRRDADAESSSYIPSTVRVNTDINSTWLQDEERTCVSYPDGKGRVATIQCGDTNSHPDHSIPIRFWGGVDRNITSDWKCKRTGDSFACKAAD